MRNHTNGMNEKTSQNSLYNTQRSAPFPGLCKSLLLLAHRSLPPLPPFSPNYDMPLSVEIVPITDVLHMYGSQDTEYVL